MDWMDGPNVFVWDVRSLDISIRPFRYSPSAPSIEFRPSASGRSSIGNVNNLEVEEARGCLGSDRSTGSSLHL